MAALTPIHQIDGCDIAEHAHYLRAIVGPGLAEPVQECYRRLAYECVQRKCARVLVIGKSSYDAFYHLAGRDVLHSMALAGLPADFRIAFVATTPSLIAVYDAAVLEAERLGLEAKRFTVEAEAERWLVQ
jgi:hypothetical protein